jgi:phosphatidylinositol phospholipase C epsilon
VFPDLAFIKFTIFDSNNNHVILQRILPIKNLKQGFRHMRLRNSQNLKSDISSLFILTRQHIEQVVNTAATSQTLMYNPSASSNNTLNIFGIGGNSTSNEQTFSKPQAKHKQFKVTVFGLQPSDDENENENDESYNTGIVVKVTQDTTVLQVIEQTLVKAEKPISDARDYILIEEMERSWANTSSGGNPAKTLRSMLSTTHHTEHSTSGAKTHRDVRLLQNHEKIMEAQNKWTGNGRFIIKNKARHMVNNF